MNRKPRLMAVMPEIIFDLDPGIGNLPSIGINFQNGGMAPVTSKDVISLQDEGTFEVYAVTPKWESSLRELNKLSARETKLLDSTLRNDMRNNFFLISHPSFNRVRIEGSNTMMYEDSWRFSSIDRAIALSAGVTNTLLNYIKPDMVWLNDWMTGPVAPVAKALGIKVITTGHNIFT
ncbi:MAG: glycogen/starch synthase, partial [Candidatus Woesearchaeota archaeon]